MRFYGVFGAGAAWPPLAAAGRIQQGDGQGGRPAVGGVEQDRNEIRGHGYATSLRAAWEGET